MEIFCWRIDVQLTHNTPAARRRSFTGKPASQADVRGRISGTALPTYILDIPGGYGKVPIGPDHLEPQEDGGWIVTDPQGRRHSYRDF